MISALRETAYAKINLALHVRQRREDGYHDIETLFAFVDAGDGLSARPAAQDELTIVGEFASQLADPFANSVVQALGKLARPDGLAIALEKNLPVAAGLGGGSADAGAVFRIVGALHGLPDDWRKRAASLGADVPACVESRMCLGHGTGTELSSVVNDLAGTPVMLVNPRVAVSTGPIFAHWDGIDHGPLEGDTARDIAMLGGNDLQDIAVAHHPQIVEVLNALSETKAFLKRMSGSGATCFALFENEVERDQAAAVLRVKHPEWWQMAGRLRP